MKFNLWRIKCLADLYKSNFEFGLDTSMRSQPTAKFKRKQNSRPQIWKRKNCLFFCFRKEGTTWFKIAICSNSLLFFPPYIPQNSCYDNMIASTLGLFNQCWRSNWLREPSIAAFSWKSILVASCYEWRVGWQGHFRSTMDVEEPVHSTVVSLAPQRAIFE